MYLYQIGCFDAETECAVVLRHPSRFSSHEFEALIHEVAGQVVAAHQVAVDLLGDRGAEPRFNDLYPHVADALCLAHGFERVEYAVSYLLPAWPSVRCPEGPSAERSEELLRLAAALRQDPDTP